MQTITPNTLNGTDEEYIPEIDGARVVGIEGFLYTDASSFCNYLNKLGC